MACLWSPSQVFCLLWGRDPHKCWMCLQAFQKPVSDYLEETKVRFYARPKQLRSFNEDFHELKVQRRVGSGVDKKSFVYKCPPKAVNTQIRPLWF